MNSRGQAFSTFQLLIAAVIALAILVLLLNIIGSIPDFSGAAPNKSASDLIAGQVNSPGELRTGQSLQFGKEDSLNAKSIASLSGVVTSGQICISRGDHVSGDSTSTDFEFTSDDVLRYNGSSSLRVKISVLCDTGTELANDLEANGIQDDWLSDNPKCDSVTQLNQTACIIALRYA